MRADLDRRPGGGRALLSSPVPERINRPIVANHPVRGAVVVGWWAVDRSIVDRGCCGSRQCSGEQSDSKSGPNSRTAPAMVMPMSGRSRGNRSNEERCRRDDCKSKLSHVPFLNFLSAPRACLFYRAPISRSSVRLYNELEPFGASSSNSLTKRGLEPRCDANNFASPARRRQVH